MTNALPRSFRPSAASAMCAPPPAHPTGLRQLTEAMHAIDNAIPRAKSTIPNFVMGSAPFFDWLSHKLTGSPRVLTPELVTTMRGKAWNASNVRIKRELGWKQTIPLDASLRDVIDTIRLTARTARPDVATQTPRAAPGERCDGPTTSTGLSEN